MRILLRNRKTRQYFQLPDGWIDDPELAMNFDDSRQAIRLAQERGFRKVDILLSFENPRRNIRLPVRAIRNLGR
jgi:hypothetical protein